MCTVYTRPETALQINHIKTQTMALQFHIPNVLPVLVFFFFFCIFSLNELVGKYNQLNALIEHILA